jgi:ABC-type multidrug transport system fused ATPase/permease subunit
MRDQQVLFAGYRRALRFVVPYWPRLVVVLLSGIAATGFGLLQPYISKLLVDDALLKRNMRMLLIVSALTFGPIPKAMVATITSSSPARNASSYAAAAPSSPVHPSSCLTDVDASAERCWTFNTAAPNVGLLASLQRGSSSGGFNETDTYTWAQDANGNSSISQTQRTLDPGQAYSVTSYVKQTVDVYGNVTAIDYNDKSSIRRVA